MIRYINFFTEHSHFRAIQYGFKSGHSTEYAIMEVIDRTITALDSNEIPINIFLDISKVFYSLDHKMLFKKIKHVWNMRHRSRNYGKLFEK